MKLTKLITGIAIATAMVANAQILITPTPLAHWDMVDGSGSFNASSYAEPNSHDCITPAQMTAINPGSYSTADSEDGSTLGANCFVGWTAGNGTNKVSFKITADTNAVGALSLFNLDIGNYNGSADPDQFRVTVLQNGIQTLQTAWAAISPGTWGSGANQNISLSGLGLNTVQGQSDMFVFEVETQRADGANATGRFALDNVRIYGDVNCVPEPSSITLIGLSALTLVVRRRR